MKHLIDMLDDLMHDLCNQTFTPEQWPEHEKIKKLRKYDYEQRLSKINKLGEEVTDVAEDEWFHFVDLFEECSRLIKIM